MTFAARPLVVLAALGAACLACGHLQNEGDYAFTADHIVRDECGLLSTPDALWDGTLYVDGQVVRIQYDLFEAELDGKYQENVESFYVDGTVENVSGTARGQACTFDIVSIHFDASTSPVSQNTFTGNARIEFFTRNSDVCSCVIETTFRADRK